MDRGAWQATIHGGHKEFDTTSCIGEGNGNPLQCSCLKNPRMVEPGGLPSMGLHRVRHDWSDLAAAAAAERLSCTLTHSIEIKQMCRNNSKIIAISQAIDCKYLNQCKWKCSFWHKLFECFFNRSTWLNENNEKSGLWTWVNKWKETLLSYFEK